jgi:hypothetical protein
MSLLTSWLCYAILGAITLVLFLIARQEQQQGQLKEALGTTLQVVFFLSLFFFWFIVTTKYTLKGLEDQVSELKAELQKYQPPKEPPAP